MYQFFSRPDRWLRRCGDLRCAVVERRIPGAPDFMRGLRALFITDVHAGPRATDADMDAFAGRIAALAPDVLLWGGDFSESSAHAQRLFDRLRGIKPPLGSYAVAGNNDREAWPDVEALRRAMAGAGMALLLNESETVEVRGGRLIIAGVDEARYGRPDFRGLYPADPSPSRFRVLLSHYPVPPKAMPDLMLCGHTHGGQFNLLGVTPYTVGFERLGDFGRSPRFIAGLHRSGGGRVFVGKGIGASRLPLRVGVRPEIDLFLFV